MYKSYNSRYLPLSSLNHRQTWWWRSDVYHSQLYLIYRIKYTRKDIIACVLWDSMIMTNVSRHYTCASAYRLIHQWNEAIAEIIILHRTRKTVARYWYYYTIILTTHLFCGYTLNGLLLSLPTAIVRPICVMCAERILGGDVVPTGKLDLLCTVDYLLLLLFHSDRRITCQYAAVFSSRGLIIVEIIIIVLAGDGQLGTLLQLPRRIARLHCCHCWCCVKLTFLECDG